jgi:hypothetical protein
MTILFTVLALATAPAPTSAQAATPATQVHAQHAQHAHPTTPAGKMSGEGCPCCDMAGGGTMACCAKHGEGHGAEHSGHSGHSGHKANR